MRVELQVSGGENELRSLYAWLGRDPGLRGTARTSLSGREPSRLDEMGSVLDVIQLITDSGWSAASLAVAVAAWRGTRPRSPQITVRRGASEITLTDMSEAEVQRLLAFLDQTGDPGHECQDQPT
ncbi:effector-associated constant component EACC1 [Embleya sp. MST-111070]|uniref:effector-associated constant component EACC1 n=1 Tax=Embleya sp. MST-111070 TaxID=3398231 RepID=UPI003F73336E